MAEHAQGREFKYPELPLNRGYGHSLGCNPDAHGKWGQEDPWDFLATNLTLGSVSNPVSKGTEQREIEQGTQVLLWSL